MERRSKIVVSIYSLSNTCVMFQDNVECSISGKMISSKITKGSLGYLSSMYFSTSLVLGEVAAPFPEIESRESRTET